MKCRIRWRKKNVGVESLFSLNKKLEKLKKKDKIFLKNAGSNQPMKSQFLIINVAMNSIKTNKMFFFFAFLGGLAKGIKTKDNETSKKLITLPNPPIKNFFFNKKKKKKKSRCLLTPPKISYLLIRSFKKDKSSSSNFSYNNISFSAIYFVDNCQKLVKKYKSKRRMLKKISWRISLKRGECFLKKFVYLCFNEFQEKALKLYNDGKEAEFKKEMLSLILANQEYFRVLDLHGDSGQQELTKDEFMRHFSYCLKPEISEALFKVMSEGKETASVVNLQVQFQGRRRATTKQREVVKDAEWLMHKLKNLDLKDIDDNEDLKIERHELRAYFKDELDEALVDQIFDAIDRDKSGSITPMEYFQWKGKAKLGTIKTIIRQAEAVRSGNPNTVIEEEEEEERETNTEKNKQKANGNNNFYLNLFIYFFI
ncbi:hypothetical protein RFI_28795 [Reticulomyxa filosa]|uniref:EF-hand domain-containing protein n=1 Tax=Reticulomyxa filosa TaxID=46433 RepID=X6M3P2_RETFI|nr:hypothetical protein RFI_28795 [Reticulomyxa filosa]|eukprot:ETO08593.1 hypothetical protein RFI_28795 [Reticulomyxa filosa]